VSTQDKWCDFYFFNSLATRLNESEEEVLSKKVLSIGIYYPQSTTFEIEASKNDKLNDLFEKHGKEGMKLIHIDKENTLFKGVYDKYQFLIVNYDAFKIEDNIVAKDKLNSDYKEPFNYGFMFPNIEAHAGFIFMNLKSLSTTFLSHGLPELKAPQMIYGGAFTLYEDWFLYGSISYHILPKTTNRYNDSTELIFNGMFLKGFIGHDATASEKFNIVPRLGIGYGRLQFQQKFDSPISSASGSMDIFNQSSYASIHYFNNAFLLDPGVDIRFNIRYLALGLNAGYQIDVSEKSWFSDQGGSISGSPQTGLSGFYAMLTLSLFYSL
jgi:hypothetical protein